MSPLLFGKTSTGIVLPVRVNTDGQLEVESVQGVVLSAVRVYTSGTPTWNKPAGLDHVVVELVAGGGGGGGVTGGAAGGSVGGSGGGGGYSRKFILAAALGPTETVTVGAGGAGGAAGANNGIVGNSSSFGAHLSATGGGPGIGQATSVTVPRAGAAGGAGGVGSSGDLNINGQQGGAGLIASITLLTVPSSGSSLLGLGLAEFATGADAGGATGPNYGAGGQGGTSTSDANNRAGGAGGPGVVIVYEYVKA